MANRNCYYKLVDIKEKSSINKIKAVWHESQLRPSGCTESMKIVHVILLFNIT